MTEQEWLAFTDPGKMVKAIRRRKASERKRRLFGCACCRHIWHLIPDERSRRAVLVAERFADGLAGEIELKTASQEARLAHEQFVGRPPDQRYYSSGACWCVVVKSAGDAVIAWHSAASAVGMAGGSSDVEQAVQCSLVLDIFSNPFQPPLSVDPSWLAWNDSTIPNLAQCIYEEGAFDRLAILADALEDAGCTEPHLLNHCRSRGLHVRGCWAVDLLLGKE